MITLTKRALPWLVLMLLMAGALARVIDTHNTFSHTFDEPTHIAAGVELLNNGDYTHHRENPPLARIFIGVGPFLSGARFHGLPAHEERRVLMYGSPSRDHLLTSARLGNIPFLALLLLVTWLWTKRYAGVVGSIVAVLLLSTLPPILGHAGLATTDLAGVATLVTAIYLFVRFLETPSIPWALGMGLSTGLAVMAKFSALPFLGLTYGGVLALRWWLDSDWTPRRIRLQHVALAAAAVVTCAYVVYSFNKPIALSALHDAYGSSKTNAALIGRFGPESWIVKSTQRVAQARIFPSFIRDSVRGIKQSFDHNRKGHKSYLLGEVRFGGWWYFYLVALAVKTPIPVLLLGIAGIAYALVKGIRQRDWRTLVPSIAFIATLGFASLFSQINIGIRHVLVLYPLMTIAAGFLIADAYKRYAIGTTLIAGPLIAWQIVISVLDHPNYLAYFNAFAGKKPEAILVDSDLDWGQDLKRLAKELSDRRVPSVAVAVGGTVDLEEHFPGARVLRPFEPTTGWVAVSITKVRKQRSAYDWLETHQPVTRVGSSFFLYHIR